MDLPYDPVIPLLGIYRKEYESGYDRDACTPMCKLALLIKAIEHVSETVA
jgi:hypothetical protein